MSPARHATIARALVLCLSFLSALAQRTAADVLVPYGSPDWRYLQVPWADPIGQLFFDPNFNDSQWPVGQTAFGTPGTACTVSPTVQTVWDINTDLLLRREFAATSSEPVVLTWAIDNDAIVYVNGSVVADVLHSYCPALGDFSSVVPPSLLVEGTNELAVLAHDYGGISYFDMQVEGLPPTTSWGSCGPDGDLVVLEDRISQATVSTLDLPDVAWFGSDAADIGDLDGNGFDEIAVGAILDGPGSVSLLFMGAGSVVDSTRKITEGQASFPDSLAPHGRFGDAVAPLGDLDRDGVPDIAIGQSHYLDGGGNQVGAVWILFLNPDGTVKDAKKVTEGESGFTADLDDADDFGVSLEYMGRCCGDSVAVLAIGAHGDDDGAGPQAGAIYIAGIEPDGSVSKLQKISNLEGGLGNVLGGNDLFGESIAYLGDLDGDGNGDLAVGALELNPGNGVGAVWTLRLDQNWMVVGGQRISNSAGGFGGSLTAGDYFGTSLATLGDVHGDGTVEVAVGAENDDDGGPNRGAVWILSLNPDGTVHCQWKLSQIEGGFTGPLADDDGFGASCELVAADLGSGAVELAIGAMRDDSGGIDTGAIWLVNIELPTAVGVGVEPVATTHLVNAPNPFSSTTTIDFDLARGEPVTLGIFDVMGRSVRTFVREPQLAGRYSFTWDGRDGNGHRVRPGVYFYRLNVGHVIRSGRMTLVQ